MKILKPLLFLLVLCLNLANNGSNAINIIGERNTGKRLYKDKYRGFRPIGSPQITKSNRQHNISAPIVSPNIFNIPRLVLYINNIIPIVIGITYTSH